jgi:uncharacterized protein YhbP (UPF0306 family)
MAQKTPSEVPPQVLDYLRSQYTLTLATATPSGVPHAATQVYVADGITLYFSTRPDSTSARNIAQNPTVAFTIDEYSPDWSKTKGIQGGGECQVLLNTADIQRALELFRRRFSSLSSATASNVSFFRIVPGELQYIDNEGAGAEQIQGLGMEYRRSLVYSVFRGLPRQEVDTLAAKLGTVRVDAGATIVRQGAPADKFFIIVEGEVEVVREDAAGQVTRVASLQQGQFFGEMAILRDSPRTATVKALSPTTLLTMEREVFRNLVAQSLATTEDFDRVIRQRLADLGPR